MAISPHRTKIWALVLVGSLITAVGGSAYSFVQSPRFFLFQLGQSIDADDSAKVENYVNVEKTVDAYVTDAIKFAQANILTQAQSTNNVFELFGGVLAVGTMNSMAEGIKVQIADQVRSNLDKALEQLDKPVAQYLLTRPIQITGDNTAVVTISKPDNVDWSFPIESLDVELEKNQGHWKVVGLSDRTVRRLFEANLNQQTTSNSTSTEQTPPAPTPETARTTPLTTSSASSVQTVQEATEPDTPTNEETVGPLVGQMAYLTADNPSARINLRDEPRGDLPTRRYGLVGDEVLVQDSTVGGDGYTWYKVQFQESKAVGWIRGDFVAEMDY